MVQGATRLQFGPELLEFGSWNWLGRDLIAALAESFETAAFTTEPGAADVVVVLKFLPSVDRLADWKRRSRIIFCPVDVYGSPQEIDADAARLQLCDHVIVHCERLARYFRGYAPVSVLPHHVKYVADIPTQRPLDGPLLWVGVQGNLPPVVDWLNQQALQRKVVILTDSARDGTVPAVESLGIQRAELVTVEPWSVDRHLQWLPRCRAAFDVKSDDFRARHKPAAKVCDYVASGVPVAVGADSTAAEHLQDLGFHVATLQEPRWLSEDYLTDTVRFGRALREIYSLPRVAWRWERLLRECL